MRDVLVVTDDGLERIVLAENWNWRIEKRIDATAGAYWELMAPRLLKGDDDPS